VDKVEMVCFSKCSGYMFKSHLGLGCLYIFITTDHHYQTQELAVLTQVMMVYMGSGGKTPFIFNLSTRWRKWSTSFTGWFTPGEKVPVMHWTGG